MQINHDLIWDYSFSPQDMQTEEFKRWYVARVLMRGGAKDIRDVGVDIIRRYLPHLSLPKAIREFWDWYFASEEASGT